MVDGDGQLTAMSPSAPQSEDAMQQLVARYPQLITDGDGDLLLIRREQPINDGADGARWSLDHLFVTRTAIPVLVELKRAVDTRLRREVVGQMLDYAANGTAYWQAGRIAETFAATVAKAGGENPDIVLQEFLGDEPGENFWDQVDANFAAGRIKLVFVADAIPRELARIIEFLNEQMRADVRGVELRWFQSADSGVTTLSPRIIGETERANAAKGGSAALPGLTREAWVERHFEPLGADTLSAAKLFLAMIEEEGGQAVLSSAQGSVYGAFPADDGKTIYPLSLIYYGKGRISLNLGYLMTRSAFANEEDRRALYDSVAAIVGPLSTRTLTGFPAFSLLRLNDQQSASKVRGLLQKIVSSARA